jgi:hypothetical protein
MAVVVTVIFPGQEAFYADARASALAATRWIQAQDKPRVERTVPFVRNSFFAGETFIDLADAQRRAEEWCLVRAGRRIHGTHACRPVDLFDVEEKPALLPAPTGRYDLPIYASAKVHRDHHIEVARALYSVPGNLIGARVDVRADSALVRVYYRSTLIKVHPCQATGGRITYPEDLPSEKTVYAMRNLDHLRRLAAALTVLVVHYLRHGIPYEVGWWGFLFPLGAYTILTIVLARAWHLAWLEWTGAALFVLLGLLWIFVFGATIRAVFSGKAFRRAGTSPMEAAVIASSPDP